jgi:hypothetical protein
MPENDSDSLLDRARDRLSAALAPTQDNDPSPQARDERPTVVGREEFREEIDGDEIEEYVAEYYRNPLIRVPIQNFSADVTEPGVSVRVDPVGDDDAETPTVEYRGREMSLDTALSTWASSSFIDGFEFEGDMADLLEEVVKDRRGRRGTAIVEHAYDDPRERERLLGLKPVKTETVTAYTREGKAIALRPDDDPKEFDSVALQDYATRRGTPRRRRPPATRPPSRSLTTCSGRMNARRSRSRWTTSRYRRTTRTPARCSAARTRRRLSTARRRSGRSSDTSTSRS